MELPDVVWRVTRAVEAAGGTVMVVGGAVVDHVLGITPKDFDLEAYGIKVEDLGGALEEFRPKAVGQEFGIFTLSQSVCDGVDIEVSVPRRDNKIGVGHRDFEVSFADLTPKEAAKRRDASWNSLFYNPRTGEVLDYWNGLADLEAGIYRATDPETFIEDPLRCLRAMQLLARKGRKMDEPTKNLCAKLFSQLVTGEATLSNERIFGEWEKLLMRAKAPSIGLRYLQDVNGLRMWPELTALQDVPQNPEHHPEGDAWVHTMKVVDAAAVVRDAGVLPEGWERAFMWAALCHDLGKPLTVNLEDLTCLGHDKAGIEPTESFMRSLVGGGEKELRRRVVLLTKQHMQCYYLSNGNAKDKAWNKLHNKAPLDILGWFSRCDKTGSQVERSVGTVLEMGDEHLPSKRAFEHFERIGSTPAKIEPLLQGRHLINAGLKPGPEFGTRLDAAYDAQLGGEQDIDKLLEIATNLTV